MLDKPAWIPDDPPAICRDLFPFLRQAVYLDTGSAGLSFEEQGRAVAEFFAAKSRGYLGRDEWLDRGASVRRRLADWLGTRPDEVEFFSGTTDALNIIGYSVDWRKGDEVVVADDEFPSVRLAWQAAERAGGVVRLVKIPKETERETALLDALSERTRVLVVTHVHSMTGTRLDLDRLGTECRKREILLVVDGIQALGAIPIGLDKVDVYMAGMIKWMLSGFGLAVCVVRDRARQALRPAFRGSLNPPPDAGLQFAHVNYPGLYALGASLDLLGNTIGWDMAQARTAKLVEWLAEDLRAGGIELAAPEGSRAGIASIPLPDTEAARLSLATRDMYAAARGKYLRATPFFYNSREDISRFATHVLKHCR